MPKLYEYFGIVVFFYANEHEPVHVHGEYQGSESKAEILLVNGEITSIRILRVPGRRPLRGSHLAHFKELVEHEAANIVKSWIDFFVLGKSVKSRKISRSLK
ncbi:MAG: DUF4160 domain-containing protein [Bacteroidetes bacterium]|nr:DUF4160 domain-containing protein [Bacteroidota bacterium]